MNEPYLSVYVRDDTLHFSKKIPTENSPRVILTISVSDVVSNDYEEATKKVGSTILGILSLWHKNEFKSWGNILIQRSSDTDDAFQTAMYLIGKLTNGCSEDRLSLIDDLLHEAAQKDSNAKKFLEESWDLLRTRMSARGQNSNC
jgi:hypothetical protein